MILFPNAKINLGLNVARRRSDGYHDIETLFYPIGWCDVLEVVDGPEGEERVTLTVTGRSVDCPTERNLVWRAAMAFREATGSRCPYDIYLHKVIPDGAGLGGGSSDAAFTLRALNEAEGSPLSSERLAEIAATIGADCAFFIYNRPMAATGIGTDLTPVELSLDNMLVAVVKPEAGVSTAEAYRGVTPAVAESTPAEIVMSLPPCKWQEVLVNDFERSVFAVRPEIAEVKSRLLAMNPVYCSMSGSGSAVYALFSSDGLTAEELSDRLKATFPLCATAAGAAGSLNW